MTKQRKKVTIAALRSRKKAQQPRAVPRPIMASSMELDNAAKQWARVLVDPCNAPLAYPCYPSAGGGSFLMRFESDAVYCSGATETGGVLVWSPGLNTSYVNNTAVTSDGSTFVLAPNSNNNPGVTFFTNTPHTKRAVAACIQVTYPGTELNRAGVIGMGITDGSAFASSVSTGGGGGNLFATAGSIRTLAQHVERTPATVAEVKWYPGDTDGISNSPSSLVASTADNMQGRNVLFVSFSGIPVSTGMRVRCVVVFEVSLGNGQGTVASAIPPPSFNTPNQVVKALFTRDPGWFIESATKAGKAVSNAISYVAAGKKAFQAFGAAAGLLL